MRRAVAVGLFAVSVVLLTGNAWAHGAAGTMKVVLAEQSGRLAIRIEVGVLHADGDLAEEATVVATLTGPGGERVESGLPRISGARYGADVEVPVTGTWRVAVGSTEPAATLSATVEIVPTSTIATTSTTAAGGGGDRGEGTSSSRAPVLLLAAGAAAAAGLGGRLLRRRRRGT